jgi:hypothetical protein
VLRRRRWHFVRWWAAGLGAVAAAVLAPLAIRADHAADHEVRLHGEHRSVPVVATSKAQARSPGGFTVEVDGRRIDIDSNATKPAVGHSVVVAVAPGPRGRVLLADDREAHEATAGDMVVVPIMLVLGIIGLGWGPGLPRYRAARVPVRRPPRTPATITAKTVRPSPRALPRRWWHQDGSYWTYDLRLEDGTQLQWRGCVGSFAGRTGETVTLLGPPKPGAWAVLEHPPMSGPRTSSWPDVPLTSGTDGKSEVGGR